MRLQHLFTVLAIAALGALAFIVVRAIVAEKPPAQTVKVEGQSVVVGAIVKIYVARIDLEVGHFLDASDLEPTDWPEHAILASQVRADQVAASELAGSVVRNRIIKGAPILLGNLVKPGDRSFLAAVLLPGRRAISIPVDNVTGHSGLLLPGDRVDVILTQNVASAQSAEQVHVGETILEAVRVLAVGASLDASGKAGADEPRAVTLEVTPKQAEMVAVARELGRLALAVRSLPLTEADEMEDELATTGADLSRSATPTWGGAVSRALGGANVEIMRGSGEKR